MNVLVIGSGGREHALVWKISKSPLLEKLYCLPGNAGIKEIAECHAVDVSDFPAIESFIREKNIGLTIVGPEQPLVEGIVDFLEERNLLVFGPNKIAAQMEGSKIFAKNLMAKYNIPTAAFGAFSSFPEACAFLDDQPEGPIVIKADGLAAGKGSVICASLQEARDTLQELMVEEKFDGAGKKVVIEEFMRGEEASLFVLTDGEDYVVFPAAQDFKRALDGDQGKNTGGMGSYAPTPFLTPELYRRSISEVIEPTLNGLRAEGIDYQGVLYCGLMLTGTGPRVVEFNCRFGDPETQVVLPLLKDDLLEILLAISRKKLGKRSIRLREGSAVCVVAASGGYPGAYEKGKKISGLDQVADDVVVFHAGTAFRDGDLLTSGGRVLGVTAFDSRLKDAAEKVYRSIKKIHFAGMQYRKDISKKAWGK